MASNHRKSLIAGNWKMNYTSSEARELVQEVDGAVGRLTEVLMVVCPPFTALESVAGILNESNILLGAQNMHPKNNGAYTGEISPEMLRSLFCSYVILGHSERRSYFHERDDFVNEKVLAALENNLKPILCVGETIAEREAGHTLQVVGKQISGSLRGVEMEQAENCVIAYEPIWAIGTGKTATSEMAQETHHEIRKMLTAKFNEATANRLRILYGGSMKPANASELLDQPDIDGGLIGGASLDAKSFIQIINLALDKVNLREG